MPPPVSIVQKVVCISVNGGFTVFNESLIHALAQPSRKMKGWDMIQYQVLYGCNYSCSPIRIGSISTFVAKSTSGIHCM